MSLIAFVGPMFASKTTNLIRAAEKVHDPLIIKIAFDNRYSESKIVSHDGLEINAISITEWNNTLDNNQNYFFDEIQFFQEPYFTGDINSIIESLVDEGRNVWIAGLDMDYRGEPFPYVDILKYAEVIKLTANCTCCDQPATHTYKHGGGDNTIELGSAEKYEPRCLEHWKMV